MTDEIITDTGRAVDAAGEAVVRVPANMMRMIRASYDSREKVLDWCLAITVVAALVWAFQDELMDVLWPGADANAGRADAPYPNQDVTTAFPFNNRVPPDPYTYNLPVSRSYKYGTAPSASATPGNPSLPPQFPVEDC